jgi:two-component system chemotaxis response regulator CheY
MRHEEHPVTQELPMRSLIVEDEFTSRMQLKYFLEKHGPCDIAVNSAEAVDAFKMSIVNQTPYDVMCLDIMLPGKNGHETLKEIRAIEERVSANGKQPIRIFMTTALADIRNVADSYMELCDEYLKKPVEQKTLDEALRKYGLIA